MTQPAPVETITRFYERLEARDWDVVASMLSPSVVYRAPQTQERFAGRDALLDSWQVFPGDWHLSLARVLADEHQASVYVDGRIGDEAMPNLAWFELEQGLITSMTDWWPQEYEVPPERA